MKRLVIAIACFGTSMGLACGKSSEGDRGSGQGGDATGGTRAASGGAPGNNTGGSAGGGSSQATGGATGAGSGTGGATGGARTGGNTSSGGRTGAGGTPAGSGGVVIGSGGATVGSGGRGVGGATVGAGGATAASGGATTTATGGSTTVSTGAGGAPASGALLDRISVSSVTAPAGVKPGRSNYRIWGMSSLGVSPVFTAPLANCGTLVCITTGTADSRTGAGTSHAYALRLGPDDTLQASYDLGAYECRGLAAEPDGHFGALLWAAGSATTCADFTSSGHIYVQRFDATGATAGTATELTNKTGSIPNCPTDFELGESRLEFGSTSYGAYYHVHSQSGHEGDTLKYVDLTGKENTTWDWGCSHSMSNLLRWNGSDKKFMPACVTDCYPGTTSSDFTTGSIGGVYINNADRGKVMNVDAGCDGDVAGELGGAAPAPSGWKIVFNAHQAAATQGQSSYSASTMNQDIGFASIASGLTLSGSVAWLTTTSNNEADSGIERWRPSDDTTEQYVVGWSEPGTAYKYKLARVSAAGAFLEGPVDATAKVKWGRRDDPFRAHFNGDIVWAWFDSASSTTMRFARVRSGGTYTCASF
jgi:hypothetical protein